MKYEITALKAPWPAGAKVGDIIDMPYLPTWAVGKCRVDVDDSKATIKFKAPPTLAADAEVIPPDDRVPAATAALQAQLEAVTAERDSLKADVASGSAALEDALVENHALQAQLEAAKSDDGKAAAAIAAAEEQAASEKAKAKG